MYKKTLCGLLAAAALSLPAQGARAAHTVPVQVDGFPLETVCYLEDGVTYVPLRTLLDTLGGWELRWDGASRSAVGSGDGHWLTACPASGTVTLDGETRTGRVFLESGRTYVPLRAMAELLAYRVRQARNPPGLFSVS